MVGLVPVEEGVVGAAVVAVHDALEAVVVAHDKVLVLLILLSEAA